ncbi:hypothetical protein M0811_10577 [Anaeramoeba ignava]|uniref:CYRIA/CYRIB Rac1 binding domain-containing protein n=1 Tax=Anaeramoeba ignava TaxID=1746090 RepID=A0A9Q0LGK6_ANAIG|nr:hypothetical protein M0811_10577 [Anaeramoeba ignava]
MGFAVLFHSNIIPLLLSRLCSTGGEDASDRLVSQQALAKQFGDIINFVLAFDEIKFEKAKIQNDFSYYRRVVSRKRTEIDPNDLRISDQKADQLSLFFAYATPMMKCVIDCLVQFKTKNEIPEHDIYETLATMSNVFYSLIETKKFENQETNIFCLRGMTGCIILYDHVHPVGSFRKKSPIMIKQCLTLLLEYQPKQQGLINAIKFSTKHLKDETTQAQVKQLLDV